MKFIAFVTVRLASGWSTRNMWATRVKVSRCGDLRVYQGWRQREFHSAGAWVSRTVTAVAPGSEQEGTAGCDSA